MLEKLDLPGPKFLEELEEMKSSVRNGCWLEIHRPPRQKSARSVAEDLEAVSLEEEYMRLWLMDLVMFPTKTLQMKHDKA